MKNEDVRGKYNTMIPGTYRGEYERERWFSTPQRKAGYDMTRHAVCNFISELKKNPVPKSYLELGPGPGTWTREFLNEFPDMNYQVVDISDEMIKLAKDNLSGASGIEYIVSDFLEYTATRKASVFFSSRAVEYFSDKEALVKKVREVMDTTSLGSIITKTPQYRRPWNRQKNVSEFHSLQIDDRHFVLLLSEVGFSVLSVRPVTFVFPGLHSAFADRFLFFVLGWMQMNIITRFFSESYKITFKG
ncbi:MAG: class I SAM-dependent methyltransferase [Candidatus Paceibacterota bacterium]